MVEESKKSVPELEALLGLWQRRYGTRPLSESPRLLAAELEPWSRHIARIDFDGDQFRVRTFGFDLIRRFGRESTNHFVEDLALDVAASLRHVLLKAAAMAKPVPGSAAIPFGRDVAIFSDLALPLARVGGRTSELLFASYEITASK